jgi:peroxiredoxin-like protein
MSEEQHHFEVSGVWIGNSDGEGSLTASGNSIPFVAPTQFGGPGGSPSPEELLLAAVLSCYSITLAYLAERRRLPLERIDVRAEAEVVRQPDRTLKFDSITVRPRLKMGEADEAQRSTIMDLANRAELFCPVSRALHGNVEMRVEPEIV